MSRERCGSPLRKKPGRFCRQWPLKNSEKCALHGGKALIGPASPLWKTGRYSKLLGKIGYDGVFDESVRDKNQISVRQKMGLLDAREARLLEQLRSDGRADSMEMIRAAYAEVMGATAPEERQVRLEALGELLEAGASDGAVWGELYAVIENRRRLTETEGKNIERMHKILTADQARAFVAALLSSLKTHVQDTAILARIGADFARLMAVRVE